MAGVQCSGRRLASGVVKCSLQKFAGSSRDSASRQTSLHHSNDAHRRESTGHTSSGALMAGV